LFDAALKLSTLAAIGLVAIGLVALLSPRRLARSYGVEVNDAAGIVWVRATGARDIVLGLILGYTAYQQEFPTTMLICATGFILSIVDFLLAVTYARRLRSEHAAHLGGAAAFLVIIALFLVP
jgi:Domain of unknown function (DUF4267)